MTEPRHDYLKEWQEYDAAQAAAARARARGSAPPPAPSAAVSPPASSAGPQPRHDYLQEWQDYDAARAAAMPRPRPEDDPDKFIRENAEFFRSVAEAHGHGENGKDSWGDVFTRHGSGVAKGIHDVAATLQQGLDWAQENGASALAARGYIDPQTARDIAEMRQRHNEATSRFNDYWADANKGTPIEWGRIGGQILGTGPFLGAGGMLLRAAPGAGRIAQLAAANPGTAAALRGAATGAAQNVLTSSASDDPLWRQAAWGAGIGGGLGRLGYGVSRLIGVPADREAAMLASRARDPHGIPLRIDQLSANPMVRFAGSVMQRAPFTGLGENVAAQQSAFNRAIAREMGENAERITPDVMRAARDRIGNVFEQTLPNLKAYFNKNVAKGFDDIRNDLPFDVPDAGERAVIMRHMDNIFGQFGLSAVQKALRSGAPITGTKVPISGNQIQALITKGSPLDRALNSQSANIRFYAARLKSILMDAVEETPTGRQVRSVPYLQQLRAFQEARYQWKAMKTVEPLAAKATTGDISPALLAHTIDEAERAYGTGGNLAELGRIGQRFMKEPPSSGTAERMAVMQLGALGAGSLGAWYADPEHFQRNALTAAAVIAAARGGGALLKAGARPAGTLSQLGMSPVQAAIRSGLRQGTPVVGPALTAGLPYLAPRHNPFTSPVSNRQQ